MTTTTSLFAQFTTATLADNAVGTNVMARYTSNDIIGIGSDTYEVTVWDNPLYGTTYTGKPGLAYKIYSSGTSYTGNIDFPLTAYADVQHPDVCLVNNGSGTIYAIVAYNIYGTVNLMMWDVYILSLSGTPSFSLASTNSVSIPGTGYFGDYVNIDGNENGDFAILSKKGIITGSCAGGTPSLNNSGSVASTSFNGDCDICMYYGNGSNTVYITYLNSGVLHIENWDFSSLATSSSFSGLGQLITPISPTTGSQFLNPRIACPNSLGDPLDFTVAYCENYYISGVRQTSLIKGINLFNGSSFGSIKTTTYNDGTINSPLNISTSINLLPAVAYDSRSNYNVWIGWVLDDYSTGTNYSGIKAKFPIVLQCNGDGTIPTSSNYWILPRAINLYDEIIYFALSGRNSNFNVPLDKLFASFANNTNADIYYKELTPSSATSFRFGNNVIANSNSDKSLTAFIRNYKSDSPLAITIYDVTGRIIYADKKQATNISELIISKRAQLISSIYLIKLTEEDGKIAYSSKFISKE